MSKLTVPQAESPDQTIPLSDVTITCYRDPHFHGENEKELVPITIPGQQLGQILAWLLQVRPGIVNGSAGDLWSPEDVAFELEGLSEVLRGLAVGDLENVPIDTPDMLYFLANATGDLAARLSASVRGNEALKRATVTLPTRKAVA